LQACTPVIYILQLHHFAPTAVSSLTTLTIIKKIKINNHDDDDDNNNYNNGSTILRLR